jgi:myosin-crossreactive antigen
MMNDRDRIMHYKIKYKITNYTTYEDLIRAIYNYEMKHFVDIVYSGKDVNTHEYGMYLVSL